MARIARILVVFGLVIGVAACDNGINLNPLTWFAGASSDEGLVALEPEGGWPEDLDRRLVVDQVTALRIEKTTAGAIVHATGLPPRLGYWDAELVPDNNGKPVNGVVSYVFKVATPRWATSTSTPYAREIEAGAFIPNVTLRDVSTVRVVGERNSLTARRCGARRRPARPKARSPGRPAPSRPAPACRRRGSARLRRTPRGASP